MNLVTWLVQINSNYAQEKQSYKLWPGFKIKLINSKKSAKIVERVLRKMNALGDFMSQNCVFSEIFIFQWNLSLSDILVQNNSVLVLKGYLMKHLLEWHQKLRMSTVTLLFFKLTLKESLILIVFSDIIIIIIIIIYYTFKVVCWQSQEL